MKNSSIWVLIFVMVMVSALGLAQDQAAVGNAKAVGTVKSISGNSFTLKTDAGAEMNITVQEATRVLRSEPGQKSLKEATPIQFSEVQAGDRMLTSGKASADGKSIAATTIVVMKQGDIASKQEKERQDWQRRSVGGLVSAVDAANSTVTISTMAVGQKKDITVRVDPTTIIRRYAPDSVKFDDAKKSTLREIKPGDQLRARGDRSANDGEVTAEEIVSGAFRNIAGTVQSVDKTKNQLTVIDLATKKPVTVTVGGESQMRKLPEMMAQRIAMRLKGGAAASGGAPEGGSAQQQPPAGGGGAPGGHGGTGGNGGGIRSGGGDMLQQILSHAPAVRIADLQKGDAIMLVATQGSPTAPPTAITLLAGVEPILSASPKGSDASTILSPWNLGGGNGADASAAQ
jgi:hypothetical protein